MKKILSVLLALILLVGTFGVAEGNVDKLFDAALALAYDTHNVTIGAEVEFRYDGELFKTMHVTLRQDGDASCFSYILDTPLLDGSVYNGGHVVYRNGDIAYACNTKKGPDLVQQTAASRDTILSRDAETSLVISIVRGIARGCEENIVWDEASDVYSINISDLGTLADDTLFYLLSEIMASRFGIKFYRKESGYSGSLVYYSDSSMQLYSRYLESYFRENYWSIVSLYGSYDNFRNGMDDMLAKLSGQYSGAFVQIAEDGIPMQFDSFEDMRSAQGKIDYIYLDPHETLKLYYQEICGEELTDELIDICLLTDNTELSGAYDRLEADMDAYYYELASAVDPDVLSIVIRGDGSFKAYDYCLDDYLTAAEAIAKGLTYAELAQLNARIGIDDEGRLILAEGEALFTVDNIYHGSGHELSVRFECTAGDYGSTRAPEGSFACRNDMINHPNFYSALNTDYPDFPYTFVYSPNYHTAVYESPDTVHFMGKDYKTMMDAYKNAVG